LNAGRLPDQTWLEIARSLNLSSQQLEIIKGVFADQTEQAIATDLNVSHHTVHTHCERLYHKLAVRDRVQLVLRVMGAYHSLILSREGTLPPLCANFAAGLCPLLGRRI
jgi:DNA-binding CsgD family transcriptional regulator